MEKRLDDLSSLNDYQNRQVILNYYNDEDFLYNRDGFHFDSIQVFEALLTFIWKDEVLLSISMDEYSTIYLNTNFQNYYIFRNGTSRLEIYFP